MILRKELQPLRCAWHFLLHDSLGRLILGSSMLVIGFFSTQFLLSFLPGNVSAALWRAVAYGAFGVSLFLYASLRNFGKVDSYIGTGDDLRRVYDSMPTAQRSPDPPFWAFGGNVQFMPWMLYNLFSATFQPLDFEKQHLTVKGLQDKTRPESKTNPRSMEDDVILNHFPGMSHDLPMEAPVIVVEPGLTCTAQDVPGSSFLRRAVDRGFRIVVIERRGHAAPLKSPRWNLFGDSDDTEQIYEALQERYPKTQGFFWIGFSSGSKLPIEGQGKFDARKENGKTAPSFVAMACICPGYNLETCFMGFKFPYRQMCLSSTKSKFLLQNEALLRSFNPEAYEKAMNSADLQELLLHVAPFAGYSTGKEYFEHENPVLFAPQVRTPCLIINAMDDPLTVPTNAFGKMPGRENGPTFAEMIQQSTCGLLLMAPSGSHCPFLDGQMPLTKVSKSLGGLTLNCWADSCVLEFFEGFLAEKSKSVDK